MTLEVGEDWSRGTALRSVAALDPVVADEWDEFSELEKCAPIAHRFAAVIRAGAPFPEDFAEMSVALSVLGLRTRGGPPPEEEGEIPPRCKVLLDGGGLRDIIAALVEIVARGFTDELRSGDTTPTDLRMLTAPLSVIWTVMQIMPGKDIPYAVFMFPQPDDEESLEAYRQWVVTKLAPEQVVPPEGDSEHPVLVATYNLMHFGVS